MTLTSLGDMSTLFITRRHNTELKTTLARLTQELSTGRVADPAGHLGVAAGRLGDLERSLALGGAQLRSLGETGQMLSTMQTTLDTVAGTSRYLSEQLIALPPSATAAQTDQLASTAATGLDDMMRALDARYGTQSLFAGRATDAAALAPAADMLAQLRTLTAGETTAAGVIAALDAWFDTAGGGFDSLIYLGDPDGFLTRPLDTGSALQIPVRADDPALRDAMKAAALAALAGPDGPPLNQGERIALLTDARNRTVNAAQPIVALQATLGAAEARVEAASVRLGARQTAEGVMRNDLFAADPFETASLLEQVRAQLETHYTLTARLNNLTLTRYLR